uniref:COG4223 family protein n=1 Tax=Reyranella sp. TaxID=1929291 RepID=UPI003BABB22D
NGQPFGPALAAVKTRLDDPTLVAPLEPYAATGLPTRRELIDAYPKAEAAVRETVRGEAQSEGFVAGLLANAESLVKVRRTDAPEDGGVTATLDAIRADLARNDLAAASTAWTNLPEPAQAASKDWHDRLAARVAADRLVEKVTTDVLGSLAESSTAPPAAPAEPTTPGN